MKTTRLFITAVVLALFALAGSQNVRAQEIKSNKILSYEKFNKEALTKEELKWARMYEEDDDLLPPELRYDKYKFAIWVVDNNYYDDDGMQGTQLTRDDFVKNGYPEMLYDMLLLGLKHYNDHMRMIYETMGKPANTKETGAKAKEQWKNEGRAQYVAEMEKAKKEMEAEKKKIR